MKTMIEEIRNSRKIAREANNLPPEEQTAEVLEKEQLRKSEKNPNKK